jgi:hypothetical protein
LLEETENYLATKTSELEFVETGNASFEFSGGNNLISRSKLPLIKKSPSLSEFQFVVIAVRWSCIFIECDKSVRLWYKISNTKSEVVD